jgi:hypothetical protein
MSGREDAYLAGPGVLIYQPPEPISLGELAERNLRSSPYLALRNITCDSLEGIVVLRGYLPTYFLKQMAQTLVTRMDGVIKVINEIEVVNTPALALRR